MLWVVIVAKINDLLDTYAGEMVSKPFRQDLDVRSAFLIPSKMHISVLPFQLIPAHTWTLVGRFGRGLY